MPAACSYYGLPCCLPPLRPLLAVRISPLFLPGPVSRPRSFTPCSPSRLSCLDLCIENLHSSFLLFASSCFFLCVSTLSIVSFPPSYIPSSSRFTHASITSSLSLSFLLSFLSLFSSVRILVLICLFWFLYPSLRLFFSSLAFSSSAFSHFLLFACTNRFSCFLYYPFFFVSSFLYSLFFSLPSYPPNLLSSPRLCI